MWQKLTSFHCNDSSSCFDPVLGRWSGDNPCIYSDKVWLLCWKHFVTYGAMETSRHGNGPENPEASQKSNIFMHFLAFSKKFGNTQISCLKGKNVDLKLFNSINLNRKWWDFNFIYINYFRRRGEEYISLSFPWLAGPWDSRGSRIRS